MGIEREYLTTPPLAARESVPRLASGTFAVATARTTVERKRLVFLDSLRGLAAVYVVLFHLAVASTPKLFVPEPLYAIAHFGVSGVYLFFIISGFSLTMTMPNHLRTPRPAVSYFCSRLFRIGPLFYVLLLLTIPRDLYLYRQHFWPGNFALNSLLMFNLIPGRQEGLVWVSWTISVEVIYYMIFPLLYRLRLRSVVAAILAISLLSAVVHRQQVFQSPYMYFSFIGYAPLFLFGQISFHVYEILSKSPLSQRMGLQLKFAGGVILLACIAFMPSDRETLMMQVRLAGGVGYSMLLIGEGLRPSRFLVSPVNRFLGRISYSIYLCHFIVITILAGTYAAVAQASPPVTTYVICSVITMAVTVVVAWAAYAGIEKPGIAVGKVVLSRLLPRR